MPRPLGRESEGSEGTSDGLAGYQTEGSSSAGSSVPSRAIKSYPQSGSQVIGSSASASGVGSAASSAARSDRLEMGAIKIGKQPALGSSVEDQAKPYEPHPPIMSEDAWFGVYSSWASNPEGVSVGPN